MLLWLLAIPTAAAQEGGFDAHGFRFASGDADLRDPLTFVRPGDQRALDASFGVLGEYARRPLLFEPRPGEPQVLLQDLVAVNLAAGFAPAKPLRLGVELPIILSSGNPAADIAVQPSTLGDVRVSALATLLQPEWTGGLGLGVVGLVGAPTGDPSMYLGEGGLFGGGALVATFETPRATVSAQVGARFNPKNSPDVVSAPTRGGDVIEGALAINLLASSDFGFGLEAHSAVAIDPRVRTALGIPAEVFATGRYVNGESGVFVTTGVGVGVGRGAGASPFRAVVGGGFGLGGNHTADADDDGIRDRDDRCSGQPEIVNGWQDDDGCPDQLPVVRFVPEIDGPEAENVRLTATRANGTTEQGVGSVVVEALPGQPLVGAAALGSCRSGSVEIRATEEPEQIVRIPLARVTSRVWVLVQDGAGRPLKDATVRYVVDDPACAPSNNLLVDGEGFHQVGVGEHTALVTAAGYDIFQQVFTVERGEDTSLLAILSPTQVVVRESSLALAPVALFVDGSAAFAPGAGPIVSQIATVLLVDGLQIRITGHPDADGRGGRQLGWARAEALRDALQQQGIDRERLVTNGVGTPASQNQVDLRILP